MADIKQQERRQRGEDFQDELRRSWRSVPRCWRMRISDQNTGTRPADEIVILETINILAEAKRTNDDRFKLSMVRPNQQKGLYDFDVVIKRNRGLLFISFLSRYIDEAYAVRFTDALRYMRATGTQYIHVNDFRKNLIHCCKLPVVRIKNSKGELERCYDLKGVEKCFK